MAPYDIIFPEDLDKKLQKLRKKDPPLYAKLFKKIVSVSQKPYLGKPLRNVLKNRRRTHVGHHVLTYAIDEENKTIVLLTFEHHDKAYQ